MAAGLLIIFLFVVASIYAVIAIPYSEAVRLWAGGPGVYDDNPRNARPVWFDWFTSDSLARTIIVPAEAGMKSEEPIGDGMRRVEVAMPFRFDYDTFPVELILETRGTWGAARQTIAVYWHRLDGEVITLKENLVVSRANRFYISQDRELMLAMAGVPQEYLFEDRQAEGKTLKGDYQVVVKAELRDGEDIDGRLTVYGRIHGMAGTDHRRRDISVALLWGAPVGLLFGILAAIGAQVSTFVLAGIATWFGGKLEKTFQWLTQVNIIIPVLPLLIMIGHFYTRSIWVMLGLIIALSVFSAAMLTYRAMFLQLKESPYIEAAQAYGAGNFRIIFRYLLPRIAPTLLPQFVLVIPSFVFLEATLAILGLGDPDVPTWGKLMNDAYTQGALYKGHYYWILQPAVILMSMGIGFALVGFALDRIFNPRLRQI